MSRLGPQDTHAPSPVARSLVFATDVLEPLRDLTAYAEGAGFDRVWTTDYPGRDAISRALFLALRSATIGVGTGIAYAFGRSPHALAASAADIQRLSGGRFVLGLGTGTRGVRRWYEADFDPPARRLAALVGQLREIWAASSELDRVGRPPIAGAGLHPAMLRTVARHCDRVLLHPLCQVRAHLDGRALPAVDAGAAGRGDGRPLIAAWTITAVHEDSVLARFRARRQVAFYLATPSYRTVVEGTAWAPVATRIRERFDSMEHSDWDALGELVPDDLLDEVAIAGSPEEAIAKTDALARELGARGIGELVMQSSGIGVAAEEAIPACRDLVCALGPADAALDATVRSKPHRTRMR